MHWTERLVHYLVGFALGIFVLVTGSYLSGWVVLSSTMQTAVQEARIEAFAAVCVQRSLTAWQQEGHDIEDLAGSTNTARAELVHRFVPVTDAADGLESAIATVCSNIIRVRA